MAKKIDLELGYEFLGEKVPEPAGDKKDLNAAKRALKELKEAHPIRIAVSFKVPWWAYDIGIED